MLDALLKKRNWTAAEAEDITNSSQTEESFPEYLRRCRANFRVDQGAIANAVDCSQGHISNLEKGKKSPRPGLELAIRGFFDQIEQQLKLPSKT